MIKGSVCKPPISASVSNEKINIDNSNVKLVKGERGAVFIPYVDEECNLSWTNDGGLKNPPTVNIKGADGDGAVIPMTNLEIEAIIGR